EKAEERGHRLGFSVTAPTVDDAAWPQAVALNMPAYEIRRTQDIIIQEHHDLPARGPKTGVPGCGRPGIRPPDAAQRDGGAGDARLDDRGNRLRRAVVNDDDLDRVQAARVVRQQRVEGRSESFAPVVRWNYHAYIHGCDHTSFNSTTF